MLNFTLDMERGMRELSANGAFLTVYNGEKTNTMTISWGFIGFMWNKPQFITVVRPQRYTKQILDSGATSFTISIPYDGHLKEALSVCGQQSGRDIDKGTVVRFIAAKSVSGHIVEGCGLYYECRINLSQQIDGTLLPQEINRQYYNEDFHFMYFGEIVDCYASDSFTE